MFKCLIKKGVGFSDVYAHDCLTLADPMSINEEVFVHVLTGSMIHLTQDE